MNKKISNIIKWQNFTMTILIVLLHSAYLPENSSELTNYLHSYIVAIGDTAVPTFFVISSYLFFYNLDLKNYKLKIKKRIVSLVIPYLIWSTIFYVFYLICSLIPGIKSIMNYNIVVFSPLGMVQDILLCKYIPQFWYIRILFIIMLLTIIFLKIVKKMGERIAIITVFTMYILNILVNPNTTKILFWIPLFWLTGWYTLFYKDKIGCFFSFKEKNRIIYAFSFFFIGFIVSLFEINSRVYFLWRNISPILVLLLLKECKFAERECKLSVYSFYIYAMHYCFIAIFRKIFSFIITQNDMGIILTYLFTSVFSVILSIVIGAFINYKFPSSIVNMLTGNRRAAAKK